MADACGRPVNHVVRPEDRQPFETEWSGLDDWYNAPPDYETFARQYSNYTRVMLRRFGVLHVDDVAQDLLLRFIERDSLPVFDPTFETKGDRAKFRSYYSRFIHTYAMGKKRNSVRLAQREPLVLDAPVGEDETVTYGDLLAEDPASYTIVEESEVRDFADRLRAIGAESSPAVATAVDAIVLLSMTSARPPGPTALAEAMGCSVPVARRSLAEVRQLAAGLLSGE